MSKNSAADFNRPCPLCEQGPAAALWAKGQLRLVRCRRCSMVYATPIPSELASGLSYDRLPYYLSSDKLAGDYAVVRFERELRLFRRYCVAGRVLDVGCSTGAFLYQLKMRWPDAYSVAGTDVAGAALDYAQARGIEVIRQSFLDINPRTMMFDAITFWAVMEHLMEPKKFLSKTAALLKPGGHCFILVPNFQSLAVRLLGAMYRYIMPDHLNYFTRATLKEFARREPEFQLIHIGSTHFNPIVIAQDLMRRRERVPEEERARLLKRTTAWKQYPFLKPVKVLYHGLERLLGWMNLADNLVLVLRRR